MDTKRTSEGRADETDRGEPRTGGAKDAGTDESERSHEGGGLGRSLEMVVTGVSGLLLAAAIAFLVWQGVRAPAPPSFEARVQQVRAANEAYHVRLVIRNLGGASVNGLGIRARVRPRGEPTAPPLAEARVTLEWLPAHSERQVVVILDADPRENELDVGFEGYAVP